jgi:tetratricopeptide (TPR) repeat protein
MASFNNAARVITRRSLLQSLLIAPPLLRAAPLFGEFFPQPESGSLPILDASPQPFLEARLTPHYPAASPLADVLKLIRPGSDSYLTEKYAAEIQSILDGWGDALRQDLRKTMAIASALDPAIRASTLHIISESETHTGFGLRIIRRIFSAETATGREAFLAALQHWLAAVNNVSVAEFEINAIETLTSAPLVVRCRIRYDMLTSLADEQRAQRQGEWQIEWVQEDTMGWRARSWVATGETVATASGPGFHDVTSSALGGTASYTQQLAYGVDHWRTVIDGACGIDIYGNNGIAAGDFDHDGFDDLYVCQPFGLPNRLYRNRGDGSFEDVTEKAGVGVLDNTACALFADLRNSGLQDLIVVTAGGPMLFLNQGDGVFKLKERAFQFAQPPQGAFTHAALADYDRDGRLDLYLCTYQYYLGLDQYHYPVPYLDARNGPPNILLHNEGDGNFVERTEAAGLNAENTRYSFACAWGDANGNGLPDLTVANDFGRTQFYRNNGDGTFTHVSAETHIDNVAAGMGACWADLENAGHQDIYTTGMWEAAGQRVSTQSQFHATASEVTRKLYTQHASGNDLYRNQGDGTFRNAASEAGAARSGWAWGADTLDFNHDGYADLYVTNGYITAPTRDDLASFFWRQVVAHSPDDATPTLTYERGWNAINELIRSDHTWNGYERNALFVNHHDGTFTDVAGLLGLDLLDDSRSFALADLDHDGRLEIILKNRNAPQLRILHNALPNLGHSIAFCLHGVVSNRDAIGAAITVTCGALKQTKYLQAGSGFLAQHSKELHFGLGKVSDEISAIVRWPNGLVQHFNHLPTNHCIEMTEAKTVFTATPFATGPASFIKPVFTKAPEPPQAAIETWLIQPLIAPEFSLPDPSGKLLTLQQLRGKFTLLHFWSTASPSHREHLLQLSQQQRTFAATGLKIVAINVDQGEAAQAAHALVAQEQLDLLALTATEDVAGIYNILYRYLYDRRRDLPLPCSFLLDEQGIIVKLYQGAINFDHLREDLRSIPATPDERLQKALPFAGQTYVAAFERNDFTYGVAFFQHGYFEQAAAAFEQVIAAKPNNAEGYYNLGTLSLRRNDLTKAREYLEQTVKLRPDYPEAWNNLGMIAAQQGQPDEAIKHFTHSLQQRPAYATALLNLGNIYRRQHQYDKALDYLSRALSLQPDDPETNYNLGMLYATQDQQPAAQRYLQRAIELRPAYSEARNNLGILYVHAQDYADAEDQFKTCIRLVPSFDQSYLNLARLDTLRGDRPAALQVLQDLLHLQHDNRSAQQALEALQQQP